MVRKVETWLMPGHADPNMRKIAPEASPEKLKSAHMLICRRVTDPPPPDVETAVEFQATCRDCGEAIMHRTLPNPTVELICIYCWHELRMRNK